MHRSKTPASNFFNSSEVIPHIEFFSNTSDLELKNTTRFACNDRYLHWSRSYSKNWGVAAGWSSRVGIDIEVFDHDCDDAMWPGSLKDFAAGLLPSDEHGNFFSLHGTSIKYSKSSIWSSKEALAKALGDALLYDPKKLTTPALCEHDIAQKWKSKFYSKLIGNSKILVCWVVFENFESNSFNKHRPQ